MFRETRYPVVISTKGRIISEDAYTDIIMDCNAVVQISMVCDDYDALEPGAPSFSERVEILRKLSKVSKRTIVRVQPYACEKFNDVKSNMSKWADAGAHGVIIEGLKLFKKAPGFVKLGGDYVYPKDKIITDIVNLKEEAHRNGLKLYCGENRARRYGDSLTCCGTEGVQGFEPNRFNLSRLVNGGMEPPSKGQRSVGSAGCFRSIYQDTLRTRRLKGTSFSKEMTSYYDNRKPYIKELLGG